MDALFGELDRFARRVLDPLCMRPEQPMALSGALGEARTFGLLSGAEPSGLGPWEELERDEPPATTLLVLEHLARTNTAFAFAVHQRALAQAIARKAGWSGDLAIACEGSTRMGRVSLARCLAGAPLDEDDEAVLADVYAPDATRVLPYDAAGLVVPVFAGGSLRWQWHEQLRVEARPAHGLDELRTALVTPLGPPRATFEDDVTPFFAAHQLGLLAIGVGTVERAHRLARRFARDRRQGGAAIDHHPAVLALLAKTRAVLETTRAELASFGRLGVDALFRAMSFRAASGLADAAHAAMQVFGGLGYMRDTGLEKVTRDVNHLRAMAGAPPELALIAAEGERLRE